MKATIGGIGIFAYLMEGISCPKCGQDSRWLNTTNEWCYHCVPCDIRFNRKREILPKNNP